MRASPEAEPWDVAVVGLGPVGLTLAGLLGKRGLRVLGLERERDLYPLPRAGHLDHSVLRIIQELGCLDRAMAAMIPNRGTDLLMADGRVLARLPVREATVSRLPASMHFHQPSLDRTLRDAAAAMPSVDLANRSEVVGLEPDGDQVLLTIRHDGATRVARAAFVVGCDGASSTVRSASGLELEDYGFAESWVVIDLLLQERPASLPSDTTFGADPARPYAAIELPGRRYRFEFMVLPDEDPASLTTPDKVERLLSPWLSPEQVARVERAVVYTFRAANARCWRRGRVLVAGDAAHLMPPFLGQGMCSGMRDAANLAWKLEHVLRKGAPTRLLDTYKMERGPHVENVIHTATRLAQALCTLDAEVAAQRDREMLASGLPPDRRLPFKLGELMPGPLVLSGGGTFMISPEVDGAPLDDLIERRFLVLARSAAHLDASATWWRGIGSLVTTLDELTDHGALRRWMDRRALDVVVVRPDHYVLGGGASLEAITESVADLLAGVDASPSQPLSA